MSHKLYNYENLFELKSKSISFYFVLFNLKPNFFLLYNFSGFIKKFQMISLLLNKNQF